MGKKIIDEFTGLPLSRQRAWQLRKKKEGRCPECGTKYPVHAEGLRRPACEACSMRIYNKSPKVRYDWPKVLNGQVWLFPLSDCPRGLTHFRALATVNAKRRGKLLRWHETATEVRIQAVPR
jgi:hypothetical protein